MEWMVLILLVLAVPVVLAIWLVAQANRASGRLDDLQLRQYQLEGELAELKQRWAAGGAPSAGEKRETRAPAQPVFETPLAAQSKAAEVLHRVERMDAAAPPTIPAPTPREPLPIPVAVPPPLLKSEPVSVSASPPPPLAEPAPPRKINWEQFVGVNLLMWLGGLAAFLTVVFTVKYSFERNWITPALRVASGFLAGLGLLGAGVVLHRRKQYRVGAQTFCATGVVILYATTFACHSIYHFEFFGLIPTFLLMVLVTATAFLLAVRLDALVVAILGLCGGFLTPVLLSTGVDNPLGLFGYIALLDAGLLAVALNKRWNFLTLIAAFGTILMQVGWAAQFFVRERYYEDNKVLIALAVFLGFSLLFGGAWVWAQRRREQNQWLTASAIALPAVALCFGFFLLGFEALGQRPGLIFSYILLVDLCLLALVWLEDKLAGLQLAAGAMVFLLLSVWTFQHLSEGLLNWALGLYFVFALLHAAWPFVLQRLKPTPAPLWWGQLFPPIALLLMLAPIFKLHSASLVLWPFVLLLDLLVLALAVISVSVVWVFAALVLTLLAAGCWILQMPAQVAMLPQELLVIGGFALFFFGAGIFAARKLMAKSVEQNAPSAGLGSPESPFATEILAPQLPALSAVLPFVLLIMVSLRLPLLDPSPVFGLALLLAILLLGLTRLFPLSWLPAVGLGCVLALEHAWHFHHFQPGTAVTPLLWYLGFTLLFAGFPFLFWRQLAGHVVPWATAALAGPLHFYLVHRLVQVTWPNEFMGLLPVAFALPSLLGLVFLIRSLAADAPKRMTHLAFFGAAALFFITLIFPIQFDRQWITIGWALEGAALLWLLHRVPHDGLRFAGVALLVTAFVRLTLNPAVLHYHARAAAPILNWYLYAYGITSVCLFVGARFLAPPRHLLLGSNVRALLATLGTILAFLLLNLEIADYFTPAGATVLAFEFSGNVARDMTYSIAWGLFALILVITGIWRKLRGSRFAGIALLCVTLLKLFFHDLANLQALYRIGALLGLAIVAIAASFLYQRFFADDAKPASNESEPKPPSLPS
jgi:uncharacterized membrane protein